jgi:hypothetical protein
VIQFSLKIPCVNNDSLFAIDFKHQPFISFRCQVHMPAVSKFSVMISRSIVTQFSLKISKTVVTQFLLTIPCVTNDSVFRY